MSKSSGNWLWAILISSIAALFAFFPLTDTDIWWHLACGREWVQTWTPVRTPVVNVHEFFQNTVLLIYNLGGAPLLVIFKAFLWGMVLSLFIGPLLKTSKTFPWYRYSAFIALLFVFRYQFEVRPIVFSLCFLGLYWNFVPRLFAESKEPTQKKFPVHKIASCMVLLLLQWLWCKCQGLFILGPLFVLGAWFIALIKSWNDRRRLLPWGLFVLVLFAMPFLHSEGLALFLYPLGLLDRLIGLTPSAAIFASQIAENRSPLTLFMAGENTLASLSMTVLAVAVVCVEFARIVILKKKFFEDAIAKLLLHLCLIVTAALTLVAERNFALFFPVLSAYIFSFEIVWERNELDSDNPRIFSLRKICGVATLFLVLFLMGLWIRTQRAYHGNMISYQRVPTAAAEWMKENPHEGRLFNDDRAGGYLAFVNPSDSIYMDGRFILKTSDFFRQYLDFAENPSSFIQYADSSGIDRAIFPLRYYARWNRVIESLQENPSWRLAYKDEFFCIFQRNQ